MTRERIEKMNTKEHYRMYKAGKMWLFSGILAFGMGVGLLENGMVRADAQQPTTEQTTSSSDPNAKDDNIATDSVSDTAESTNSTAAQKVTSTKGATDVKSDDDAAKSDVAKDAVLTKDVSSDATSDTKQAVKDDQKPSSDADSSAKASDEKEAQSTKIDNNGDSQTDVKTENKTVKSTATDAPNKVENNDKKVATKAASVVADAKATPEIAVKDAKTENTKAKQSQKNADLVKNLTTQLPKGSVVSFDALNNLDVKLPNTVTQTQIDAAKLVLKNSGVDKINLVAKKDTATEPDTYDGGRSAAEYDLFTLIPKSNPAQLISIGNTMWDQNGG
ncbi:KxYKxGKxW signal peptide domain-containing protein [Pediococcus argentinicus]|uniref:Uncharacterized protein n=1 Tax=Pediococcus argentinicus TaxID=480391 RepID=A0A0R2NIL5_9LACO|nr:KxYKxGKxW signal peptide domain-containing protein [Pediococcus argentinicus]KRO25641.1 hypothetical protein IV88_GL001599 [Pediococcus argentinicus]NKZ22021.1 KxYKxGKxW signal peptide domain-containing protein [Pediococcus argentinicus]GEP19192.1 hypothetical protein LSA03_05760 [Pediococcus argentinicus]